MTILVPCSVVASYTFVDYYVHLNAKSTVSVPHDHGQHNPVRHYQLLDIKGPSIKFKLL